MRRILWMVLLVVRILGAVLLALPALAQEPFDLVLSGELVVVECGIGFSWEYPTIIWRNPDRVQVGTDVVAVGSADGRTVFAVLSGDPLRVVRIMPNGVRTPFFTGPALGSERLIAVARTGRVFVADTGRLLMINAAGELEATHTLPARRPLWGGPSLTVLPDGCTLLYGTFYGSIGRINGCTGQVLPDFLTPAREHFVSHALALSSGDVLVAEDGAVVALYSPAGERLRYVARTSVYGVRGLIAGIAVAADEQSLWLAIVPGCQEMATLLRVSMATGRELERVQVRIDHVTGFVAGAPAAPTVPALSPAALAALAATLALAAFFLLRTPE